MKTDYNTELLNALNSVFWYDGLFDKDDSNCVILKLIDELRNKETKYGFYSLEDACEVCNLFKSPNEFNVIWIMLVEMFGNCGTSPRTGWIEERSACADFLELVTKL